MVLSIQQSPEIQGCTSSKERTLIILTSVFYYTWGIRIAFGHCGTKIEEGLQNSRSKTTNCELFQRAVLPSTLETCKVTPIT